MPADRRVLPTGHEIAQRAQELKITHLALMLTLPSILHPELPVLRTLLAINGQSPDDDFPVHLMDKAPNDVERLVYSSRDLNEGHEAPRKSRQ